MLRLRDEVHSLQNQPYKCSFIGVTGGCMSRRNQPAQNPLLTIPVAFLSLPFITMSTYMG